MAKKILIIEDSPTVLAVLKEIFEKEGYSVVPAKDGEEGLKKAKEETPGLAIIDTVLPGIDGFAVCKKIKSAKETKQTRAIIITGVIDAVDAVKARKMGADDYCAKTEDFAPLITAVNRLLK